MIESYVVQKLENGNLSLSYQKVGEANASYFVPDVGAHEIQLLRILHSYNTTHWAKELKVPVSQLEIQLQKIFKSQDAKSKLLSENMLLRFSQVKAKFFKALNGSETLFETGSDGYPAFRQLTISHRTNLHFSYFFSENGLTISPTIDGTSIGKQQFQVIDPSLPYVLAGNKILELPPALKPTRLKAFSQKAEMEVAPQFVSDYAKKIILKDLNANIARLSGNVRQEILESPALAISFSFQFPTQQLHLFEYPKKAVTSLPEFLEVQAFFNYGNKRISPETDAFHWQYENKEIPHFTCISRNLDMENTLVYPVEEAIGVSLRKGKTKISFDAFRRQVLPKLHAWNDEMILEFSPEFRQLGLTPPRLQVNFNEKIDYFEIKGTIDWNEFTLELSKLKSEATLTNGWIQVGDRFFPVSDSEEKFLIQILHLSQDGPELRISRKTALAIQNAPFTDFQGPWQRLAALIGLPPTFDETVPGLNKNIQLRDYQKQGLEWMLRLSAYNLGGILADDMGLGKTIQAASYLLKKIAEDQDGKPALVVMPSSLIFNWKYELQRISTKFRLYIHSGPGRVKDLSKIQSYANVILVSFQILVRDIKIFQKSTFSTLIIDEAHYVKNRNTVAYLAIQSLKNEQVFLLTGTPLQNSMLDLWTLSELCNPGLLSQKLKPSSLGKVENSKKVLETMATIQAIMHPLMLRRTKENVLGELPAKSIVPVYCTMTEAQEALYLEYQQKIISDIHLASLIGNTRRNMQILKGLTTLRLLASHPSLLLEEEEFGSGKFDLVIEKLEEVLAEDHKVLLFSSFVRHLRLIQKTLDQKKISYSILTGESRDRESQVQHFRTQKDCQVFLISLKAGGVGLNLVEASYVFLLDPWWNPATENQAMDRAYRIGQNKAVTVYKFITTNTVEEKMVQLQERKQVLADQLFNESNSEQKPFSIDLLQEILMSNSI